MRTHLIRSFFNAELPFVDYEKLVQQRQLLDGQLNENKNVYDELNLIGESNNVSEAMLEIR